MIPKKTLSGLALASILTAAATGGVLAQPPAGQPGGEGKELQERVQQLHEDISTINLLNGLNLTREQVSQVLELARQASRVRQEAARSPENLAALQEAAQAFQVLKDEIQKGAPARGEVPARAVQINQTLTARRDAANRHLSEQYRALEGRLTQVLSPEQVQVVQNFKPCLIPPVDLRDPVRAGQAASPESAVNRLRRMRALPEAQWQARKEAIAQRTVDWMSQHHYRLTDAEKATEKSHFIALVERARRMPDMDFEIEKDRLAQELKPSDRLQELRDEIQARNPHEGQPHLTKVGRLLLGERIIPILERRQSLNVAGGN